MSPFSVGGVKKLAVRWNYGFAVYNLANPAAPQFEYIQNLRDSGYPKNGDGSDRTGAVAASDDGQRLAVPWTDIAGFGTIAMYPANGRYAAAGDYLPNIGPGQDSRIAVLQVGARYIAFTLAAGTLTVADLTNLPTTGSGTPGNIPSETVPGLSGILLDLIAFQGGGKSWVVVNGYNKIYLGDVTNVGASVPGLSSGFVWKTLTLADFTPAGAAPWSAFNNVTGAAHPTENVPYIMAEGLAPTMASPSPGFTLVKVDSTLSSVTKVGSYVPAAPYTIQTTASTLVPYDTEVLGMFLTKTSADATKLTAVSSSDFTRDLSPGATFGVVSGTGLLRAVRGTGSTVAIYSSSQTSAWAAGLNCVLSNSPAVPTITADKVLPAGGTAALTNGAGVFIGDTVRVYPRVSPPDAAQPLTDWRFDYDFHAGNAADSDTAYPMVKMPDLCRNCGGGQAPPASIDLVGPCDPRNTSPAAPNPATGAGCWTSVTTNSLQGGPDFQSATAPTAASLSFGLEAQNGLNGVNGAPMSGLASFSLVWNVPQPKVSSLSVLYGDPLVDGSDGSPDTSSAAWEWYIAPTAGATTYARDLTCTGPTCAHAFPGKGSFGYFMKVPYKGGYVTPDCTKVNESCTNALGTIVVSDVVLALAPPASVYRTEPVIPVASLSRKSTIVTGSFTYEICSSPCSATPTSGTATLSGDPFAAAGGGYVNVPMPAAAGTYDVRITYTYTGPTECASAPCKVYAPSQTGWSQVLVSNAVPIIKLTIPSPNGCFNGYCNIYTGDTGKAYVYVNGVVDPAPPAGAKWLWGNGGSAPVSKTGASFAYSTAGSYVITLQGYGADVTQSIDVSDRPVGGGGGGGPTTNPPSVSSLTWSPQNPDPGQVTAFNCHATPGDNAISGYTFSWGDNTNSTQTSSPTASHAYATAGNKAVQCVAYDTTGLTGTRGAYITVGSSTGSCDFVIRDSQGARISYDPVTSSYDAAAGKPLTFAATGLSGTANWNFGDGMTGTGNPAAHTYLTASGVNGYTAALSGAGCAKSYTIYISGASLDFGIIDAGTGTPLASPTGVLEARAGQQLKFTATGATGAVSWVFGDGETSAEASPVKTYGPLVDTTYTVRLTSDTSSQQKNLLVKGSTGAALTGNYSYKYADGTAVNRTAVQPNKPITFTGADQATTYTWDFGDGSLLQQGSPTTYSFTRGGTFTVVLTVARSGVPGTVSTPTPVTFTVLPPPDPLLWVAGGMAYVDGSKGELFQSDLSIFNPGTQPAAVSVAFVSGAAWIDSTKISWTPVAIVAGGTEVFTNVLSTLFHSAKPAYGVVLVRGDNVQVAPVIVSRTYNAASADAGTFGLSVPAVSVTAGVGPQSAATAGNFLAGLRHDAAFRTNLTVANLKDETAEVEVIFRDGAGTVLGSPARIRVEARGVKQLDKVLSAPPVVGDGAIGGAGWTAPTSNFSAEVKLTKGSGVYPYATVIDQGTGDSIVVTPVDRPSNKYRLPGIVRVQGKTGSFWVSDVVLLNPSAKSRKVLVTFSYVSAGSTRRMVVADAVTLPPYQMLVGIDFVRQWLGLPQNDLGGYSSSFVDFEPAPDDAAPTEPIIVGGKTYTPSGSGSIGLQVDPYTYDDGIGTSTARKRIVLSGLAKNSKYRTNVALFLAPGSTGSAQVNVRVLDEYGREAKRIDNVGLDTLSPFVQLDSGTLFSDLTTDDKSRATVVIDSPRGTALVAAYATVIDETSQDATFVAGQPVP